MVKIHLDEKFTFISQCQSMIYLCNDLNRNRPDAKNKHQHLIVSEQFLTEYFLQTDSNDVKVVIIF